MNRNRTVAILVCLLLLRGSVVAGAQPNGPSERIEEITYSGDGEVPYADDRLFLWQSEPHQFTLEISTAAATDGDVCLVSDRGDPGTTSELTCEQLTIPAGVDERVPISIARWPSNGTGGQQVHAVIRPSGSSTAITSEPISVTVIRKDDDPDDDGLPNRREAAIGSDLRSADTDEDGLTDGIEVGTYETSPTNNDSDGDGLTDWSELRTHRTAPNSADSDADGLSDPRELAIGTNPNRPDTDGDGIADAVEVNTYDTDPTDPDTDADGLADGRETETHRTNPRDPDTDDDRLPDALEVNTYGTDPNSVDSDGDGLEDGAEVFEHYTEPTNSDSDGDGLSDGPEVNTYGTDPTSPDTDGDGLLDGEEVNRYGTNPTDADSDADGRGDAVEVETESETPYPAFAVAGGLVLLALAIGWLRFRPDPARIASIVGRPRTDESTSAPESEPTPVPPVRPDDSDDSAPDGIPLAFLSNDEQVLRLLAEHDGQMRQADLVEATGWSKSKVSRVLGEMVDDDKIVKINVGKGNVVTLPDKYPSGAESPFDP